ncbi:hypothetical protein Tco_0695045 [Tanacetum coccineum]
MESCDPVDTPMVEKSKLDENTQGKSIDPTHYRGMVGTSCILHQVAQTWGLWYSKDSAIALTAFADADHAGCQDTRRSTSGSMQLLGDRLVSWSSKRYHFIKEQVENGVVELYFVRTEYQLADIFTKALCRERIEFLIDKLGVRSFTPDTLKELADEAEELNPEIIKEEPTFQVFLDALALTPCYSAFIITADVLEVYMHQSALEGRDFDALPTGEEIVSFLRDLGHTREIHSLNDVVGMYHQKNVEYVELLWEDFIYQIDNKAYKKQEKMHYPRFNKVIIHHFLTQDKTVFWRNKIRMHTSKDDYLINTLRFVSAKEETQIDGAMLPESFTSLEMKETKAYKTYLGFATGATPPKKARKLIKPASPKLTTVRVSIEEPTRKSKRVKRPIKKSTKAPARVALKEDASFEEVPRKSMRDFHKTRPSGSGAVKIIPSVTSEDEDDEEEVKDEHVKSPSNDSNDEDETNITDKVEGDEDEEMDYTTSQLYDDVDIRLNEPFDTDKEFVQEEGTDAAMTNKTEVPVTRYSHSSDLAAKFLNFSDIPHTDAEIISLMDAHVHREVPRKKTPTLLTVPVLVITDTSHVYSTIIPQALPSFTPPPQQSTSIPPPTAKTTNPLFTLLDFALVFQFNNRIIALEKAVVELKKDPLHTQVIDLVDDHLDTRLGASRDEFMNFLSTSLIIRITKQVKNQLPQILLMEVSNYSPPPKEDSVDQNDKSESYLAALEHKKCYEGLKKSYDLKKTIFSTYSKVYSLKRSRKDKDKDKGPSDGSHRRFEEEED